MSGLVVKGWLATEGKASLRTGSLQGRSRSGWRSGWCKSQMQTDNNSQVSKSAQQYGAGEVARQAIDFLFVVKPQRLCGRKKNDQRRGFWELRKEKKGR